MIFTEESGQASRYHHRKQTYLIAEQRCEPFMRELPSNHFLIGKPSKKLCKGEKLNNHFYLDTSPIKAYHFHSDENRQIHVEELKIGRSSIPFSTLFDTVNKLREEENFLNDIR